MIPTKGKGFINQGYGLAFGARSGEVALICSAQVLGWEP